MMKLELLPNEILLTCFGYLHCMEMFYSFNNLNYRFNQLIRSLSKIHIHNQFEQKKHFNKFCMLMMNEPELKKKIYSIEMSNRPFINDISNFLSSFPLNEFPHLEILSLKNMDHDIKRPIYSMLPLMTELTDFHIVFNKCKPTEVYPLSSFSKLRKITINKLDTNVKLECNLHHLTHLTLLKCAVPSTYNFLKQTSSLKYLHIQAIYHKHEFSKKTPSSQNIPLIHLKTMILSNYDLVPPDFEQLISLTPNLHCLTMQSDRECFIDASLWKNWISLYIRQLKNFKFSFEIKFYNQPDFIQKCYEQFQTNFWLEEHQWRTSLNSDGSRLFIRTIPWQDDKFHLYSPIMIDKWKISTTFSYVKTLCIYYEALIQSIDYHFPHVISLTLCRNAKPNFSLLNEIILERLSKLLNSSNLQHLCLRKAPVRDESILLLEILKRSPRLSSLVIQSTNIPVFLRNIELCKYLNQMIITIDCQDYLFKNLDDIKDFCRIFSNIQHLKYYFSQKEFFIYLLKNLPYLSTIELFDSREIGFFYSIETFVKSVHIKNTILSIEQTQPLYELSSFGTLRNLYVSIERNANKI